MEGNIMHSEARCATCQIVIRWQPTVVEGRIYCCIGCAQGGPCECDYDHLPRHGDAQALVLRKRHDLQVRNADS
jgi:hypothetical protein